MPDFTIEIHARERSDHGFDLQLEADGGVYPLGVAGDRDQAAQLIYDALTAPLADAEKLATVDELSTTVQAISDAVVALTERVEMLTQQVAGIDVLVELGKLAETLASARAGVAEPRPPSGSPKPIVTPQATLRRAGQAIPGVSVRPSQPAGPDRGLRRQELVPHQNVGGAVPRGQAVTEHGEG